jgi:hypothetical protein
LPAQRCLGCHLLAPLDLSGRKQETEKKRWEGREEKERKKRNGQEEIRKNRK